MNAKEARMRALDANEVQFNVVMKQIEMFVGLGCMTCDFYGDINIYIIKKLKSLGYYVEKNEHAINHFIIIW